jgi:hypothetical protein
VLVPVDGGATLDLEGMIEVLTALKAPLMIRCILLELHARPLPAAHQPRLGGRAR